MRRLAEPEIDAYDVVDAPLARRVRVQRVPVLPPGSSGMTVGRFVLLRRDGDQRGGRKLLAHELVHVRQFRELGFFRFLWRYVRDYARNLRRFRNHRQAYLAIPFEIEARADADEWSKRRGRLIPKDTGTDAPSQ